MLRETELNHQFELRKMQEETKRETVFKEVWNKYSCFSSNFSIFWICIRLIPLFCERDVEKYFVLSERVLTWPKEVWTLLLQCLFSGKAQEAYATLSPELILDYDKVKAAVLRTYELVPEAYWQKCHCYKKNGRSDLCWLQIWKRLFLIFGVEHNVKMFE